MPRDVGVIVVAAGRGERAGGGVPKQYRELAGVPMLLRALRPFTAHADVLQTVVVLPAADVAAPPSWLAPLAGASLTLVAGGAERADSVAAGLAALHPAVAIVLVHDAARPFVSAATIDAVLAPARAGRGAVAAVPLGDTLKEAAADGVTIVRTVPRERLWRAQTPQAFPRALLTRAHAAPRTPSAIATDDAALVEALGAPVELVADSARNFKVTTAEDVALAELLLRGAT